MTALQESNKWFSEAKKESSHGQKKGKGVGVEHRGPKRVLLTSLRFDVKGVFGGPEIRLSSKQNLFSMDRLLEQLEAEISALVDKISHYQPIEDCSKRIFQLDLDAVQAFEELRQHYDACKRLENLKLESSQLDKEINETLVGLSDCRKLLETTSIADDPSDPVAADVLLNYATKITRFTKRLPGGDVLPWPTEDQIRKGMLATVAVQRQEQAAAAAAEQAEQAERAEQTEEPVEPDQAMVIDSKEPSSSTLPKTAPKPIAQPEPVAKTLINLDLDSDSD